MDKKHLPQLTEDIEILLQLLQKAENFSLDNFDFSEKDIILIKELEKRYVKKDSTQTNSSET